MSHPRKVLFNLAPVVYLYKKCCDVVHNYIGVTEDNEAVALAEPPLIQIPGAPPPPLRLFCSNWWEIPDVFEDTSHLKIEIPKMSIGHIPDGPTPPPYDQSPLSPNSHQEIQRQRKHEEEFRRIALEAAHNNFNGTPIGPAASPHTFPHHAPHSAPNPAYRTADLNECPKGCHADSAGHSRPAAEAPCSALGQCPQHL
jgi:hypothetical protein